MDKVDIPIYDFVRVRNASAQHVDAQFDLYPRGFPLTTFAFLGSAHLISGVHLRQLFLHVSHLPRVHTIYNFADDILTLCKL